MAYYTGKNRVRKSLFTLELVSLHLWCPQRKDQRLDREIQRSRLRRPGAGPRETAVRPSWVTSMLDKKSLKIRSSSIFFPSKQGHVWVRLESDGISIGSATRLSPKARRAGNANRRRHPAPFDAGHCPAILHRTPYGWRRSRIPLIPGA